MRSRESSGNGDWKMRWDTTGGTAHITQSLLTEAKYQILGAAILAVPHVIGAPQPEVHSMLAPEALEAQFKIASQLTNAAFWLALGLISAWLFRRKGGASYPA